MGSNIIRDGYTMQGRINAVPGLHCGIEFEFRPMLSRDVAALDAKLVKATGEQAVALVAKAVADRLVSWSETQENGDSWPITPQNYMLLPFTLFYGVADIVRMLKPSDIVPTTDDDTSEIEALLEGSLEAALRGN